MNLPLCCDFWYGFQNAKSTSDILLYVTHYWLQTLKNSLPKTINFAGHIDLSWLNTRSKAEAKKGKETGNRIDYDDVRLVIVLCVLPTCNDPEEFQLRFTGITLNVKLNNLLLCCINTLPLTLKQSFSFNTICKQWRRPFTEIARRDR